jgi:hypothetical protein
MPLLLSIFGFSNCPGASFSHKSAKKPAPLQALEILFDRFQLDNIKKTCQKP